MKECEVAFYPGGKKIRVARGTDILNAALSCAIHLTSSCGGEGTCGRCKVRVKKGDIFTEPTGRLTKEEQKKGYVLACRTAILGDAEIEIPASSLLRKEQILTEEAKIERLSGIFSEAQELAGDVEIKEKTIFTHSPLATKMFLSLPPPTLDDNVSDLERLYREIRKKIDAPVIQTGLANVKKMGRLLRESNWQVTVLLGKRNGTIEVVLIEPGDTTKNNYGVALDIGTTTIVAKLVDTRTKKILGTKAAHNRQASFGEDVITRMIYAAKEEGLEKLHHLVIDTINELIYCLVLEHKINLNEVTGVMCAGNMTMTHLLLRVDPSYIRRDPYIPTANFMPVIRAAEAGIKINPRGLLACLPGVSSYVGGDISAGVLASGIYQEDRPCLLIDIGTNGEIVLGNKEWLVCCSSSAGPAFEGSGVACGVRAMEGAIQKLEIEPKTYKVKYETINNARPIGICGSGYIEILAELLKAGIIARDGKIKEGSEFILAPAQETATNENIVITQADVNNLIRSKGAIYTAAKILSEKVNIRLKDIEKIYLAGGFGNYLNIEKSILIGLLPDLPLQKFEYIGNSSIAGAKLALLSYEAMSKIREIARKMTYIELSTDAGFMQEYTASLFLPHSDIK